MTRSPSRPTTPWRELVLVAVFVAAIAIALRASGLQEEFTLRRLHEQFAAHMLQGSLVFIALFVLGNIAHVPGLVFLSAAVLALGAVWGAALTYVAAIVSCAVTFAIVRLMGRDALRRLRGRLVHRLFHRLDSRPVTSIAALRLLMQTLPTLNYALAMSGVRFRHYMLGTLLGLPLPILLLTLFLDQLGGWLHLPQY